MCSEFRRRPADKRAVRGCVVGSGVNCAAVSAEENTGGGRFTAAEERAVRHKSHRGDKCSARDMRCGAVLGGEYVRAGYAAFSVNFCNGAPGEKRNGVRLKT